jgi:3-oxoacyl-[acyl-carrier protein] reductase
MSESEYKNNLLKKIPFGRFGNPEEVAALVSFLISDNGEYVSGQSLVIDGGMSKII